MKHNFLSKKKIVIGQYSKQPSEFKQNNKKSLIECFVKISSKRFNLS